MSFKSEKDAKMIINHSCEQSSGHVTNIFHPGNLIGDDDDCIDVLAHLVHEHGLVLKPALKRS